jgi:hypothetical protein
VVICYARMHSDRIDRFLRELKEVCLEPEQGNKPFWDTLKDLGKSMSLIGRSEALNPVRDTVVVLFPCPHVLL